MSVDRITKSFSNADVKFDMGGEQGQFIAKFAELNVIDKDGDVLLSGILGPNSRNTGDAPLKVRIASWGHKWQELPVGRGEIYEEDGALYCAGKFFLNTEGGLETYTTVKELGDLAEWSFGFDIEGAEPGFFDGKEVRYLNRVRVFEVSPVLQGAGIGTHTVDMKSRKAAAPSSSLALVERTARWDSDAAKTRIAEWAQGDWAKYRKGFLWYDEANSGSIDAYKLCIADVKDNQLVAIPRAIFKAAHALSGGREDLGIPEGDIADLKRSVEAYYDAMRGEFNDLTLGAPWKSGESCELCGCESNYPTCVDCGMPKTDCDCWSSKNTQGTQTELLTYEVTRAKMLGVPFN